MSKKVYQDFKIINVAYGKYCVYKALTLDTFLFCLATLKKYYSSIFNTLTRISIVDKIC